jgi:outer membrane protein TolC
MHYQDYQFKDKKKDILNKVVTQYYSIQNHVENVNIAKEALVTAQEAYDLVSARFAIGEVSALDLTTSQQNLKTAMSNLAQSRFNLDLSWITFESLIGKNKMEDLTYSFGL